MSYIETAARFERMSEDGKVKKVTERFLVDALSCTEAESRTIEELTPYVSGDLEVTANKKVNISEVMGDKEADKFYLAKVAFVTIDERTAKEKKTVSQWLIGGTDFNDAYEVVLREINKCMADIEIQSLSETAIREFYPVKV